RVAQSARLVAVYPRHLPSSGYDLPYFSVPGPEFPDIRSRVNAFGGIAGYDFNYRNFARESGEAERVLTMRVTAGFFEVLDAKPARGRMFTDAEAQRREGCVAVLSHDPSERTGSAIGSTF